MLLIIGTRRKIFFNTQGKTNFFLVLEYSFFGETIKLMKRILKRYKSTLSILGGGVPKTEYKPLKRKLQNASKPHQPTAFKNLLRSRGYCV